MLTNGTSAKAIRETHDYWSQGEVLNDTHSTGTVEEVFHGLEGSSSRKCVHLAVGLD